MSQKQTSQAVTLIGVPLDLGAKNLGVNIGPEAFRHQSIIKKLQSSGLNVTDNGNIAVSDRQQLDPGDAKLRYLDEIVRVNTVLAEQTKAAIQSGNKVVIVGGDHSVNLGAMSGASARQHLAEISTVCISQVSWGSDQALSRASSIRTRN
jgi:arginase